MQDNKLSPGKKAKKTGQWAKIMTKWLITYSTKGVKKWQLVSFEGAKGGESRGIVDFIAIRRDHKSGKKSLKVGDLFEIILIQAKGGSAPMPSPDDILRLSRVGEYYHAKHIILADWQKGKAPTLYSLVNFSWEKIKPKDAFI
ncbi:MAG: hypothetical protein KA059_00835 [Elusimicrobiales bacterium]|nr:hypothetical protein [Elusimicrobiales bacterium]